MNLPVVAKFWDKAIDEDVIAYSPRLRRYGFVIFVEEDQYELIAKQEYETDHDREKDGCYVFGGEMILLCRLDVSFADLLSYERTRCLLKADGDHEADWEDGG